MVTMESKTSDVGGGDDDGDTCELTTVLSCRTFGTVILSRKIKRIKGTPDLLIQTSVFNGHTLADDFTYALFSDQPAQSQSSAVILDPFPIRDGGFLTQSEKKTGDIAVEWPTERSSNRIVAKRVKENISEENGKPVDIVAGNKLPAIFCMPPPVDKPKFSTAILDPFPIRDGGSLSQSEKKTGDIAVEWPTERSSNRIVAKRVKENISEENGKPVDIVAGNKLPTIFCMPPPVDKPKFSTAILDPFPIRDGGFLSQSEKKTGDIAVEWPTERSSNRRVGIVAKRVKENISEANGNRPVDIAAGKQPPTLQPLTHPAKDARPTTFLDPFQIREGRLLSQPGKQTDDIAGERQIKRSNQSGNPVGNTVRREHNPPSKMPPSPMLMVVVRYAGQHSTFVVRPEEAVSVLRGKLQETKWKLPERYELIHNLRVMDETRSFAFNHVLQGDLIQIWPQ